MAVGRSKWLAVMAFAIAAAGPARAADLGADLAGRSLSCGWGVTLHVAADLSEIAVAALAAGDFPIHEERVRLVPASRGAERITFATTGPGGREVYLLQRRADGERPVALFEGRDTTGDDCAVEPGRAGFVETRFNLIRESLCGNDPLDGCIKALGSACGREPTPACVAGVRPRLEAINRAGNR